MKKAAIYIRVSTNEQEVGLQETEVREFAERRGWEYKIFTDRGQSGSMWWSCGLWTGWLDHCDSC